MAVVLAPEILRGVVRYCDLITLKAFRLVSRLWAEECAKIIFAELRVRLVGYGFDYLQNISRHDTLRHLARTLIWETGYLDSHLAEVLGDTWPVEPPVSLFTDNAHYVQREPSTISRLVEQYGQYYADIEKQAALIEWSCQATGDESRNRSTQFFLQTMEVFPNIDALVADSHRFSLYPDLQRLVNGYTSFQLFERRTDTWFWNFCMILQRSGRGIKKLSHYAAAFDQLPQQLPAVPSHWYDDPHAANVSVVLDPGLEQFLSNLEQLDLICVNAPISVDRPSVSLCLAACRNLRVLRLGMPAVHDSQRIYPNWTENLAIISNELLQSHFTQLEKIELCYIKAIHTELVHWLRQSRHSLLHLTLHGVSLQDIPSTTSTTTLEFLETLRSSFRLRHFSLSDSIGAQDGLYLAPVINIQARKHTNEIPLARQQIESYVCHELERIQHRIQRESEPEHSGVTLPEMLSLSRSARRAYEDESWFLRLPDDEHLRDH